MRKNIVLKATKIMFIGALFCLTSCDLTETESSGPTTPTLPSAGLPPIIKESVVAPAATLTVTKEAIDVLENILTTVRTEEVFMYRIEVSNTGDADATAVEVQDVIPEGLDVSYLEFSELSWYDCSITGRTLNCALSKLGAGRTFTVIIDVASESRLGSIENIVTVSSSGLPDISDSVVVTVVP